MRSPLLKWFCFVFLSSLNLLCEAQTRPSSDTNSWNQGPLIDCQTLRAKLDDPRLVILDLGPEKELYDEGHLPGALYVDWIEDITDPSQPDRYKLISKKTMENLIQKLGIHKNSRIVLYDDLDSRVSIRMYWSLKYYGLTAVQLLDGGRAKWKASQLPLVQTVRVPAKSDFQISTANSKLSVDLDFVADRLQNPNVSLIDGRPAKQFSGEKPGKVFHTGAIHKRKGHIPGATNIFWKDNFNEDGTFKSATELAELYESVTGSDQIVTYCNEGLHATPPWFVLSELLGHEDVRVYDDSLGEWANTDQPLDKTSDKKQTP